MKQLFLIALISIVFANSMYSQQTITSITNGCRIKFSPDKKEFVFTSDEEEFSEEVFRFPLETASACLKKDVIKFYGLQKKYDTELKVSMFMKTDEYKELYESLCYYYEAMTNPNIKGYFFIQLDKETKYDLKQRCFNIKIKVDNIYFCTTPNYYSFGKGIALTYPSSYIKTQQVPNQWNSYGNDIFTMLKTIVIPEEIALKIEENYPSSLLIVFQIQKSAEEFIHLYDNVGWYSPIVLGKTVGAYIVNEKTGEVYSDMSSIFKK